MCREGSPCTMERRYKSEKGKGTTVTVVIPMEQEEHDEEA